jgi:hypothetical protein
MKQKSVNIQRGLYVIRYDSAQDVFNPPRARVDVEPGSEGQVAILSHPDVREPVLTEPGTCLVVRALRPATLRIEMVPGEPNASVAASVRLEPLFDVTRPAVGPADAPQGVGSLNLDDLRLLGHIAVIGDVDVAANEWIGGPLSPSRIEGFALEWPGKPDGVEISYAARIGGARPATSSMLSLGTFAGTRGRALPLVGAIFELSGPAAAHLRLCVEAIFLGSTTRRLTGQRIVLSGPTGRETLVGLSFGIEPVAQPATATKRAPASRLPELAPPGPAAPLPHSGRVRVFRSRSAAKQPVDDQIGSVDAI